MLSVSLTSVTSWDSVSSVTVDLNSLRDEGGVGVSSV